MKDQSYSLSEILSWCDRKIEAVKSIVDEYELYHVNGMITEDMKSLFCLSILGKSSEAHARLKRVISELYDPTLDSIEGYIEQVRAHLLEDMSRKEEDAKKLPEVKVQDEHSNCSVAPIDVLANTMSLETLELLRQGFQAPYINQGVSSRLKRHILNCRYHYNVLLRNRPHCAFVGSSGCGKTRTVIELAYTEGEYVCYVSLRRSTRGFPSSTPFFGDELVSAMDVNYYIYLIVMMEELISQLSDSESMPVSPENWMTQQVGFNFGHDGSFWSDLALKYKECRKDYRLDGSLCYTASEEQNAGGKGWNHLLTVHDKLESILKKMRPDRPPLLVFAFDEASSFLREKTRDGDTPLLNLVSVLRRLPCLGFIFCVLIDSCPKINSFPASSDFHLLSQNGYRADDLHEPFIEVTSFDLAMQSLAGAHPCNSELRFTLKDLSDPSFSCMLGRPLWSAIANESYSTLLRFSVEATFIHLEALANNVSGTYLLSSVQVTAIMGPRFALDINPILPLVHDLTAHHMRPLKRLSGDRLCVFTEFTAEPILAEVSSILCHYVGYYHLVKALVETIRNNVVDRGYWGELVARIIVLIAWDKACVDKLEMNDDAKHIKKYKKECLKNQPDLLHAYGSLGRPTYFVSLPVISFLTALLPSEFTESDLFKSKMVCFDNYFVRCNQFIPIRDHLPDRKALLECFIRGTGTVCKLRGIGFCLIIPMVRVGSGLERLGDDRDTNCDMTYQKLINKKISVENVSCLVIQLEDIRSGGPRIQIPTKMSSLYDDIPRELHFLSLMMCLGSDNEGVNFVDPVTGQDVFEKEAFMSIEELHACSSASLQLEGKRRNIKEPTEDMLNRKSQLTSYNEYLLNKQVCMKVKGIGVYNCIRTRPPWDKPLTGVINELLNISGLSKNSICRHSNDI